MASVHSRRWFIRRLGMVGCALPLTGLAQVAERRRVPRIGFSYWPLPDFDRGVR